MAEVAPVATLGDVSDLRFNNHRGIKALVSIVLLLGCVAYLASQIKAGASFRAIRKNGKFHGKIPTTTPIGLWNRKILNILE